MILPICRFYLAEANEKLQFINIQKILEPQALDNQAARELIRRISNIEESISSFHDAMRNQSYSFRPFEIKDSARFSETT